jgi:hypothetical protein
MERIQDQESIQFNTTIGAWEGPLAWGIPTWSQQGGAGRIILPGNDEIITITLKHPAIIVQPPGTFWCGIDVAFELPTYYITMKVKATDGKYTYEGQWYESHLPEHWEFPGTDGAVPEDWNIEGTTMQLFLFAPGPDPTTAWVDEAHFNQEYVPPEQPPQKIQYLPIVGIG